MCACACVYVRVCVCVLSVRGGARTGMAQGVEAAQSLGTGLYMYERLGKRGA